MSTIGTRSSFRDVMSGLFKVVSTVSPRSKNVEVETPEAYAEWGAESTFDYDGSSTGFEVIDKYDPLQGDLYEEGCKYSDIKVENPEDSNQSVIVRRYDAISFKARPKPTHKADQTNIYPQVLMTFSNYEGDPAYAKLTTSGEFHPVALDPFNTIVDVSWASRLSLVYCFAVAPAVGGNCWLTFNEAELNSYFESGKGILSQMDSGSMSKPRELQTGLFHPETVASTEGPAMPSGGSSGNFSFANNFPGVFHAPPLEAIGLNFSSLTSLANGLAYYRQEGTYGHLMMRWYSHGQETTTSPIVGVPDDVRTTNTDWAQVEWNQPQVQAALYQSTQIPAIGADGDHGSNLESKQEFWKFTGSYLAHMTEDGENTGDYEDTEYKIYTRYVAAWTHYYDPSPYVYGAWFVDLPMLFRAIATIWPGQDKTVELIFNAQVNTLDGGSGDPYTGTSQARAYWFAASANDTEKLKSLSIDRSKFTYLEQGPLLDCYASGTYLTGQVPAGMASLVKASQQFGLPPGTQMTDYPYEHARYDIDTANRSLNAIS